MAQIEVFYKPVQIAGVTTPYFHEFLVYTDDNGVEYYVRGGPAANSSLSPDSGGGSGSSGSGTGGSGANVPFGQIITESNEYVDGTIDYAPPGTYPGAVLMTGSQAEVEAVWTSIKSFASDINSQNIAYGAAGPNSNTVINAALQNVGLPPPPNQGLSEEYAAPGADVPLTAASLSQATANTIGLLSDYLAREISEFSEAISNAAGSVSAFLGNLLSGVIGSNQADVDNIVGEAIPNGITVTASSSNTELTQSLVNGTTIDTLVNTQGVPTSYTETGLSAVGDPFGVDGTVAAVNVALDGSGDPTTTTINTSSGGSTILNDFGLTAVAVQGLDYSGPNGTGTITAQYVETTRDTTALVVFGQGADQPGTIGPDGSLIVADQNTTITTSGSFVVDVEDDDTTVNNNGSDCTDGINCTGDSVNGTGETVDINSGSSVTITGSDNISSAGSNAYVALDGTGNSITATDATVALTGSSSATLNGTGDTVDLYNGGNTVTMDYIFNAIYSYGNDDFISGWSNVITLEGTGSTVDGYYNAISISADASFYLVGIDDDITATDAQFTLLGRSSATLNGTGDLVTMEDGGNTVTMDYIFNTIYSLGNGDFINGWSNVITLEGTDSTVDGNYNAVSLYADMACYLGGIDNDITATDAYVTLIGASSATLNGTGDVVDLDNGGNTLDMGYIFNTIYSSGNSDVINGWSNTITLAGDGSTVDGDYNAISVNANMAAYFNGIDNDITATDATVSLTGDSTAALNGTSNTVDLDDGGNTLDETYIGNTVYFWSDGNTANGWNMFDTFIGNSSAVNGNYNYVNIDNGLTSYLNGTGDFVNGYDTIIQLTGDTSVTLNGSGDDVDLDNGFDSLTDIGSGNTLYFFGTYGVANVLGDTEEIIGNDSTVDGNNNTIGIDPSLTSFVTGINENITSNQTTVELTGDATTVTLKSGTGNEFDLDNSDDVLTDNGSGNTVYFFDDGGHADASGDTIGIFAGSNVIAGSNDTINDYTIGTIDDGTGSNVYLDASDASITDNAGGNTIYVDSPGENSGASEYVGASEDTIYNENGYAFNLSGFDNAVTLTSGSYMGLLSGSGDSIEAGSNSQIQMVAGTGATVFGNGNTIDGDTGNFIIAEGSSDIINTSTSTVDVQGASDTVGMTGGTVNIESGSGANNVTGSNLQVNDDSNGNNVFGSNDDITMYGPFGVGTNGANETVSGGSITVDVYGGSTTVEGSNDTIEGTAGDTVEVTGSSDVINQSGGYIIADFSGPVNQFPPLTVNGGSNTIYVDQSGDSITASGDTIVLEQSVLVQVYGSGDIIDGDGDNFVFVDGSNDPVSADDSTVNYYQEEYDDVVYGSGDKGQNETAFVGGDDPGNSFSPDDPVDPYDPTYDGDPGDPDGGDGGGFDTDFVAGRAGSSIASDTSYPSTVSAGTATDSLSVSDPVNNDDGTSVVTVTGASANVLSSVYTFSSSNAEGTLTNQVDDLTDGTSVLYAETAAGVGVPETISTYSGADASGILTSETQNLVGGTSVEQLFSPVSGVSEATVAFAGVNDTGAIATLTIDETSGQSVVSSGGADGATPTTVSVFAGADGTGAATLSLINLGDGTSTLTELNPSSGVASAVYFYARPNATGQLKQATYHNADGSSEVFAFTDGAESSDVSYTPSGQATTLYSNPSGADQLPPTEAANATAVQQAAATQTTSFASVQQLIQAIASFAYNNEPPLATPYVPTTTATPENTLAVHSV